MGCSIRLEGDVRGLMRQMKHFADMDKKRITSAMASAVRFSTLERFKQEKGPDGKKWKQSIRVAQEGGKTLTHTALMKNSIQRKSDASGFAVGTNVLYASTHQLGDKERKITIRAKTSKGLVFKNADGKWIRKRQVTVKVKIPARPFLGLSEEDLQELKGTLEDAIGKE